MRLYRYTLIAVAVGVGSYATIRMATTNPAITPTSSAVHADGRASGHATPTNYLGPPSGPPPSDAKALAELRECYVGTAARAEAAATGFMFRHGGFGADERVQTTALYRVGRYDRLGHAGDWVWEVHAFVGDALDSIYLVNAKSGGVAAMGRPDTEPARPQSGGR